MTSSSNNICSSCHMLLDDGEHHSPCNNNNNNTCSTCHLSLDDVEHSSCHVEHSSNNVEHSSNNVEQSSNNNNNIFHGICKACSQPIYHSTNYFITFSFCNAQCIQLYEKQQKQIKIEKKLKILKKLHKDGINNNNIVGSKRTEKLAMKTYKKMLRPRKF